MKIGITKRPGFTLVEILIVVAIIGLLIAIAIPSYVKARTTSQRNVCIDNLRVIDGATKQWALETKAAASASVTTTDVLPYLKSTVACPAGGPGATFSSSYALTTVAASPTCNVVSSTHVLP